MDRAGTAVRSLSAADRRPPESIGRSARLELVFGVRRGHTVLVRGYAEPPLRVGRPFPDGDGLHVILTSSAPGIFGLDTFVQHVVVECGARVRLTSQSAVQVHAAVDGGSARLHSRYDVADDAELRCEWDPVIPFAASRFEQHTEIVLAPTARLSWSEALMAGREGHGERWQFASLSQELRVTRGETLEYLERYRIQPDDQRVRTSWVAGDCCYFGTTLASGWPVSAVRMEQLHHALAGLPGVEAGVDRLAAGLTVTRLASPAGPPFHAARRLVLEDGAADQAG